MGKLRNLFVKILGGVPAQTHNAAVAQMSAALRNYSEVAALGSSNSDWSLSAISQDSDIWQNNFALRQRLRDLFDTDPFFRKYQEQLAANVLGEGGVRLRMKVKEVEDRIVYVGEEKAVHLAHQKRVKRVAQYIAKRTGSPEAEKMIRSKFSGFTASRTDRAEGKIEAGALDLYANQLIERKWAEWKQAKYATVSGKLSYQEAMRICLISAARDGDIFIRKVAVPSVNKFGFAIQLIHAEWCDYNFNRPRKGEENEVRMGVEIDQWGKPVAYYFIKRQPGDWMFAPPGGYFLQSGQNHVRIEAKEIIHYARFDYSDSTRPAAWGVSAIPLARQLQKYIESAVIAARAGACQAGWFYSDLVPEGGTLDMEMIQAACKKVNDMPATPGMWKGLPWGVKPMVNNPNNPNSNFGEFRKEIIRAMAAALPGGNYNILANDSEGISYSTGRIFSLDDREQWKQLQRWHIDKAEIPIFEAWLEMGLMTGEIPLPLRKFDKFNKPVFSGRRWDWVDPMKDAKALEVELGNFLTSWTRIFDERGEDLEEVWLERAEELMLAEQLGLKLPVFDTEPKQPVEGEEPKEENEEEEEEPKPNGKPNGRHVSLKV